MVKGRGPKYANGNYKNQQKAFNNTKEGRKLIVDANLCRRRLQRQGKLKKASKMDAAHIKGKGREACKPQHRSKNRRSRLKVYTA